MLAAAREEVEVLTQLADRAAADLDLVDPLGATRLERRLAAHVRALAASLESLRGLVEPSTGPEVDDGAGAAGRHGGER